MKPLALVVEDNPRNRRIAADRLEFLGYMVHCVEDGEAALAWARHSCADLVLLDIHLPGVGGEEVFRALRSLPGWAKVPVIATTASVMPEQRQRLHDAGFDRVLEKPWIPIQNLDAAVAAVSRSSEI